MPHRSALLAALSTLAAVALAIPAPAGAEPASTSPSVIVDAGHVHTPWEIVPMPAPDGHTLVTTFDSSANWPVSPAVRVLGADDALATTPAYVDSDPDVTPRKFLGLVLSPDFATNHFAYLYETYNEAAEPADDKRFWHSRILRLTYDASDASLHLDRVLFARGIRSDYIHDGGRMVFGPDGDLYVTTGDVHDPTTPQNVDRLNGKILRMTEAGLPPDDNPFNDHDGVVEPRDYVWSYGHRHSQGLVFVGGQLWEAEHGPTGEPHAPHGASNGRDELNRIVRGGNYGWPLVAGEQRCPGTIAPVYETGPAPALAPGDLAYSPDDHLLYAPGLNGKHLRAFKVDAAGALVAQARFFDHNQGRLRAAVVEGDQLWLTTDEDPNERILRVPLDTTDTQVTDSPVPPAPAPYTVAGCQGRPIYDSTSSTPSAPAGRPATTPAGDLVAPSPIAPALPSPATAADSGAVATARLVARARSALRRAGVRGLLRRGRLGTSGGGFPAGGTVELRVVLRRSGRAALTVADGVAHPQGRRAVVVRARLTRAGRAALRSRRHARLTVVATFTPAAGSHVRRAASVTA